MVSLKADRQLKGAVRCALLEPHHPSNYFSSKGSEYGRSTPWIQWHKAKTDESGKVPSSNWGFCENQYTKHWNPPVPFSFGLQELHMSGWNISPLDTNQPRENLPKIPVFEGLHAQKTSNQHVGNHESRITSLHQKRQENQKETKATQRKDTI